MLEEIEGARPAVPLEAAAGVTVAPQTARYAGRRTALIVVIALLGVLFLVIAIPAIRWRVQVVYLVLVGRIPDLEFKELPSLLVPGAGQPQITRLVITRNPYAVVHVPVNTPANVAAGATLFRQQCADCHSPDGSGGPGAPALFGREFQHGDTEWAVYRTIRDGVPKTGMSPHPLKRAQLWQLVAYIRTLGVPADSVATSDAVAARLSKIRVP
jgi:mono/diheme cytochrome c family protein